MLNGLEIMMLESMPIEGKCIWVKRIFSNRVGDINNGGSF